MNKVDKYREHVRRMKEDPDYKKEQAKKKEQQLIEYWKNLDKFEKSTDVPPLPNPLNDFYTNRLIELGAIPKEDLKDDNWYYGNFRNSNYGKWDKDKSTFHHIRYSFGYYWDKCNHFEDDDRFALFVPLREATPEEIKNELLKIENK